VVLCTIASTSRFMQLWDKYVNTGTDAPPGDAPSPEQGAHLGAVGIRSRKVPEPRTDTALTIHTVCLGCRV